MYDKKFIQIISQFCNLAHFFGSSPILMNTSDCTLYYTEVGLLKSFFLWLITAFYVTIFIPSQIIQMYTVGNFEQFTYLIIICLCAICGVIVLGILILRVHDIVVMLNFTLTFVKYFEKTFTSCHTYCAEYSQENCKLLQLIHYTCMYQVTVVTVLIGHYFLFPSWQFYLTSEMQPEFFNSFIYISYGIGYGWAVIAICLLMLLGFFILLAYFIHFIPIFGHEFRLDKKNSVIFKTKATGNLRKVINFTRVYRALEIMLTLQNQVIAVGLLPLQTCAWFLCVFCFVTLEKHWKDLQALGKLIVFGFGCVCMLTWTLILKMAGHITVTNGKTRHSWKRAEIDKLLNFRLLSAKRYMKRFGRSCRPINVGYGKMFVVKPGTVLRFLKMLSRGILKALLASRKISLQTTS